MKFREYLAELFDKPWSKTLDLGLTAEAKTIYRTSELHKADKISHVQIWKLEGSNGHMISMHRNGALEVHHHDSTGQSGVMHLNPDKPNPRFISTMKDHLLTHGLGKGYPIRIMSVGDKMKHHYSNIAKLIMKKSNIPSKMHEYSKHIDGKEVHHIEIHPRNPLQGGIANILSHKL